MLGLPERSFFQLITQDRTITPTFRFNLSDPRACILLALYGFEVGAFQTGVKYEVLQLRNTITYLSKSLCRFEGIQLLDRFRSLANAASEYNLPEISEDHRYGSFQNHLKTAVNKENEIHFDRELEEDLLWKVVSLGCGDGSSTPDREGSPLHFTPEMRLCPMEVFDPLGISSLPLRTTLKEARGFMTDHALVSVSNNQVIMPASKPG